MNVRCFLANRISLVPCLSTCLFTCLFTCLLTAQTVYAREARVARAELDKGKLPDVLLNEALSRGGTYYSVYPYGDIKSLPLSTRINGLRNNEIDLFHALSTPEYEEEFIAVYIPIYRGMMGMRLAIVKESQQNIFANVETLQDLSGYSAGQGKYWADAKILQANQLSTVTELKYKNLFRMLEADRFDYFPRGIHEPWSEVERWSELDLAVEPNILLYYQAPMYFFVRKSMPELAEHLEEQLEAMILDGSFQRLFYQDPEIKAALAQANLSRRTVIQLANPFLTEQTPVDRKELWLDLENFSAAQVP